MTAYVTLAIGVTFICTVANAAPAQIQSDQTAVNQEFDWNGIVPVLVKGLTQYAADRIANGQNQDAEVAAIKSVSSQDAKAANFWKKFGPKLVSEVGTYLADRIANGENQETQAQFLENIAPLVLRSAGNYIANRIANGETIQNEEAEAQFWGTALRFAAPYILNRVIGDEIAMSEVAKALPEEARAEGLRRLVGGYLSRQLG